MTLTAEKFRGVVVTPPSLINDGLHAMARQELAKIPEGKSVVARLNFTMESGVQVALAAKIKKQWTVVAWVGRDWDSTNLGVATEWVM